MDFIPKKQILAVIFIDEESFESHLATMVEHPCVASNPKVV